LIAILLCAGYATRMYPFTTDFPKPLLPVAGKPVLDYLMAQLLELQGIDSVHIITNDRFAAHFETWRKEWAATSPPGGFRLIIHNDGSTDNENRLGASGDLAWLFNRLPKVDRMLVSAGDNIFRFPLKPLWNRFVKSDFHYILGLPEINKEKLKRTGIIEFGIDDRAIRLHEKPANPPSNWSCPATYFFQASVVPILQAFVETSENQDAPGYFVDYLCQKSHVKAFKLDASRLDIGSIEDYHKADLLLRSEPVFPLKQDGI
jgi:glucose-1-phosphate thymidylyltransferase